MDEGEELKKKSLYKREILRGWSVSRDNPSRVSTRIELPVATILSFCCSIM